MSHGLAMMRPVILAQPNRRPTDCTAVSGLVTIRETFTSN